MGRKPISDGVFVGQEWCHNTRGVNVTVVNIYRKDGRVMVDNDVLGTRYTVAIRDLKANFYPRTIYIERKALEG